MIIYLTGIFLFLASFNCLAQTTVRHKVFPAKIATNIHFVIPVNGEYVLENYSYFKYKYWLQSIDTLELQNDSTLVGRTKTLNLNDYPIELDICDSFVNMVRNSALEFKSQNQIEDTARKYIGYNNQVFLDSFRTSFYENKELAAICHNRYIVQKNEWFQVQLRRIDQILTSKQERLESIEKSDTLSRDQVNNFLKSYHYCPTDLKALLLVVEKSPDNFLLSAESLTDSDFWSLEWTLRNVSKSMDTTKARQSLENSTIRTRRKSKLKRKLKN